MTKNYYVKKSVKYIKELKLSKNALEYYKKLSGQGDLSASKKEKITAKITALTNEISAIEGALSFLSDIEHEIIDKMYISSERSAEDLCGDIPLERSSIYRYRKIALEKISMALFGRI
ncbi:MAG: hypothetical protein E7672_01350 [Ruminococcaceae bacterium]|nr:hypothetical protein [Oscillospiraceae bacterium]